MAFSANILVSIGIVVATINVVSGQVPGTGLCPQNLTIQQDFKLDDYMGNWFEYERYPFIFEIGKKCNFATYTKKSADTVGVVNSGVNVITKKSSNVTGEAKVIRSGELSVYFSGEAPTTPNYIVLSTDYKNYAVVYSCKQLTSFMNTKVVWVLTRERLPSTDVIQVAHKVIDDNNLSKMPLMQTSQSNCGDDNNEMDFTTAQV